MTLVIEATTPPVFVTRISLKVEGCDLPQVDAWPIHDVNEVTFSDNFLQRAVEVFGPNPKVVCRVYSWASEGTDEGGLAATIQGNGLSIDAVEEYVRTGGGSAAAGH